MHMSQDPEGWSDSGKWWMDLLKSAIIFCVATIVAICIVADIEDKREVRRVKESTLLTLRQQTVPDFVKAAVHYETASYIAYTELYQWVGVEPTQAMRAYESVHDGYLLDSGDPKM